MDNSENNKKELFDEFKEIVIKHHNLKSSKLEINEEEIFDNGYMTLLVESHWFDEFEDALTYFESNHLTVYMTAIIKYSCQKLAEMGNQCPEIRITPILSENETNRVRLETDNIIIQPVVSAIVLSTTENEVPIFTEQAQNEPISEVLNVDQTVVRNIITQTDMESRVSQIGATESNAMEKEHGPTNLTIPVDPSEMNSNTVSMITRGNEQLPTNVTLPSMLPFLASRNSQVQFSFGQTNHVEPLSEQNIFLSQNRNVETGQLIRTEPLSQQNVVLSESRNAEIQNQNYIINADDNHTFDDIQDRPIIRSRWRKNISKVENVIPEFEQEDENWFLYRHTFTDHDPETTELNVDLCNLLLNNLNDYNIDQDFDVSKISVFFEKVRAIELSYDFLQVRMPNSTNVESTIDDFVVNQPSHFTESIESIEGLRPYLTNEASLLNSNLDSDNIVNSNQISSRLLQDQLPPIYEDHEIRSSVVVSDILIRSAPFINSNQLDQVSVHPIYTQPEQTQTEVEEILNGIPAINLNKTIDKTTEQGDTYIQSQTVTATIEKHTEHIVAESEQNLELIIPETPTMVDTIQAESNQIPNEIAPISPRLFYNLRNRTELRIGPPDGHTSWYAFVLATDKAINYYETPVKKKTRKRKRKQNENQIPNLGLVVRSNESGRNIVQEQNEDHAHIGADHDHIGADHDQIKAEHDHIGAENIPGSSGFPVFDKKFIEDFKKFRDRFLKSNPQKFRNCMEFDRSIVSIFDENNSVLNELRYIMKVLILDENESPKIIDTSLRKTIVKGLSDLQIKEILNETEPTETGAILELDFTETTKSQKTNTEHSNAIDITEISPRSIHLSQQQITEILDPNIDSSLKNTAQKFSGRSQTLIQIADVMPIPTNIFYQSNDNSKSMTYIESEHLIPTVNIRTYGNVSPDVETSINNSIQSTESDAIIDQQN